MKKATGKVVSLVLALALVITSFSATFAFAATRTETGEATIDTNKELYLANTNGNDNATAADKRFNLTEYIFGDDVTLETYDHIPITTDIEISQVSVSGSNIIKVTKLNKDETYGDEGDYIVTVRDAKGTGTATINVLLTGTTTERGGEDEITVRGSVKIDVTLLDAKTPILTSDRVTTPGKEPAAVKSLQKNPNASVIPEGETEAVSATVETAYVVLPVANGTAIASYVPQEVEKKNDSNSYASTTDYVVSATGTRNHLDVATDSFNYGVTEPSVGNTVRLTVSSLKKVTSDSKDTYQIDKTAAQQTVKVENKIVADVTSIDVGDATRATVNGKADTLLSKSKTYAKVGNEYWDVTGGAVVDTNADLAILAGRLGDVTAEKGNVTVNDGTVGNIVAEENITLDGGSVTSAKAEGSAITIQGATVGEIKAANTVDIYAGEVTGAVSANTVMLNPMNDEEPVSVGAVKAIALTIDGTNAAAKAASYFATETESSIILIGDKASVGAIDFDYRNTILTLDGFVGSIPAPTKGTFTGYDATGATINTDTDDETKATISGNLAIYNLDLQSGAVTFTGNLKVANLTGSEADLIINAGALNITDSVATSNTLKIADASAVTPGTVVYTATTDIADEDSFINYGFSLRRAAGTNTDAFVIDGVSFAGLTMNVSSAEILLGTSETFTASAYPNGTSLPEGAYIKFFLDADENYIYGVDNGNGSATIQALKYDSTFDVLNKGTLTAQVYDEYDIQLEEYGEATVDITVIEKPKTTYVSDTTGNVDVAVGNTYQFKITSTDGSVPSFAVAGDGNIFRLVEQSNSGNDYFFKVQAVGTPGQVCGVYINREATPVATLTVDVGYECDTTTVNVAVGASYIAKVTANEQPVVASGNSSYTVELASQSGNDYFFRITAVSAQVGDQVGFYINSSAAPVFIATTV